MVAILRQLVYGCNQAWHAIWIGFGVLSTAMSVFCVSPMGALTNTVVGLNDCLALGETVIAVGWNWQDTSFFCDSTMLWRSGR